MTDAPPYAADIADMSEGECTLLGGYGARSRWACTSRMGSNAEEEDVNGEVRWVHYVR